MSGFEGVRSEGFHCMYRECQVIEVCLNSFPIRDVKVGLDYTECWIIEVSDY